MLFFQMGSYKEAVCLVCFLGLVTMSYGSRIVSSRKGRKLAVFTLIMLLKGGCRKVPMT